MCSGKKSEYVVDTSFLFLYVDVIHGAPVAKDFKAFPPPFRYLLLVFFFGSPFN